MLRMYTDGSCTNNGKASSRGAIGVAYPDFLESSFGEPLPSDVPQTNQTAELNAIYGGLERLKTLTPAGERVVRICTDSEYSINCLTKWVVGWRKKNWKTAEGKDVVHRVVIEKILDSLKDFGGHQFVHVKAHTGCCGRRQPMERCGGPAGEEGRGRQAAGRVRGSGVKDRAGGCGRSRRQHGGSHCGNSTGHHGRPPIRGRTVRIHPCEPRFSRPEIPQVGTDLGAQKDVERKGVRLRKDQDTQADGV